MGTLYAFGQDILNVFIFRAVLITFLFGVFLVLEDLTWGIFTLWGFEYFSIIGYLFCLDIKIK